MSLPLRSALLLLAFFAPACADDGSAVPAPGPRGSSAGLAVLTSDYQSVALALVDPGAARLLRSDCITSGSRPPGLTTALSGDVVLPSQPPPGHEILVIDRGNATLTWLDPSGCTVLRQLSVGEGMAANPHDVITVSAHKAYVTRWAAEASDLLIIDPTAATVLGTIDLRPRASRPDAHPNPDRGVLVDGRVYVSLNALVDLKTAGPGRVLRIDPATDAVTGTIDLPALQNCGSLAALASPPRLAVACAGLFADGPGQVDSSGLGWVDLAAVPPTVTSWTAAPLGRALSGLDVALFSPTLAFVVVPGDFDPMTADALWAVNPATGPLLEVLRGSGPFRLGGLTPDLATGRLYLGDADPATPRLLVVGTGGQAPPDLAAAIPFPGLPPRSLVFY